MFNYYSFMRNFRASNILLEERFYNLSIKWTVVKYFRIRNIKLIVTVGNEICYVYVFSFNFYIKQLQFQFVLVIRIVLLNVWPKDFSVYYNSLAQGLWRIFLYPSP